MQFATPGTRKLIVRAANGSESETAQATIEVEASTTDAPVRILMARRVAEDPYLVAFTLGTPPRLEAAIARENARAGAAQAAGQRPAPPKFNGLRIRPGATTYKWDLGDGHAATTESPTVTHDYFPAIQADQIPHSFHVTCSVAQENVTATRTLVLNSAYGLCRAIGAVVPPVNGDTYASFEQVGQTG
jgi:hypothetical protein